MEDSNITVLRAKIDQCNSLNREWTNKTKEFEDELEKYDLYEKIMLVILMTVIILTISSSLFIPSLKYVFSSILFLTIIVSSFIYIKKGNILSSWRKTTAKFVEENEAINKKFWNSDKYPVVKGYYNEPYHNYTVYLVWENEKLEEEKVEFVGLTDNFDSLFL